MINNWVKDDASSCESVSVFLCNKTDGGLWLAFLDLNDKQTMHEVMMYVLPRNHSIVCFIGNSLVLMNYIDLIDANWLAVTSLKNRTMD